MKFILFVVSVLGVAALGSAQVAREKPTISAIRATAISQDPRGVHMRGAVEIQVGTVRIVADEADTRGDSGEFELRGNVRLLTR
jgi:lipopolysaccharide assembly outer membrane protein LptD (OstA)